MKKLIHYIIAAVFFLFGIVQYNDPDFYLWVPVYLITAFFAIAYQRKLVNTTLAWMVIAGLAIWTSSYLPDIIEWVTSGMDSITGSMKAESPHIELAREFFGLLLCLITVSIYQYLTIKKR